MYNIQSFALNRNLAFHPTRLSLAFCIASVTVSFFGYLPRFAPYFVFSIKNIFFPFPKFWVLVTGMFYFKSLFSLIFSCFFFVYISNILEPIIGSKEVVHLVLMSGFYTNCLYFIIGFLFFSFIPFSTYNLHYFCSFDACLMSLIVTLSYLFIDMTVSTFFMKYSFRLYPFIFLVFQIFSLLLGNIDGFFSSIFGLGFTYLYIRYIKKNNGIRGDPSYSFRKLLPTCLGGQDTVDNIHSVQMESSGDHPFSSNHSHSNQDYPFRGTAHRVNM